MRLARVPGVRPEGRAPPEPLLSHSLLEMMLESALTDLKESGPAALPGLTHNALKLLRLLQDFLFSEGHNNQALWSEKVDGSEQGFLIPNRSSANP